MCYCAFPCSEDTSYEIIEELQQMVWFIHSNLNEKRDRSSNIVINVWWIHLINLARLTWCPAPGTSTYVKSLYSTVYPATWPSNAVKKRVLTYGTV